MVEKTNRGQWSSQKIFSFGVFLLGIVLIIESVFSVLMLIETVGLMPISMLIINLLYLLIKTLAGVLLVVYWAMKRKN